MSAAANRELIERLYHALQQRDGEAMAACYRADATFRDPVFDLNGTRVGAMWKMLCSRGADLRIEFANVDADDSGASADWQAWYTFSGTGRHVHNIIRARLRLVDGMIAQHIDEFDFWRWSRQALGPTGLLLGWTPLVRGKVRAQAAQALERFVATNGAA